MCSVLSKIIGEILSVPVRLVNIPVKAIDKIIYEEEPGKNALDDVEDTIKRLMDPNTKD